MRYGYFDDQRREYVIDDPRTPVKWINYIGTLEFGGFVDHTGGALICRGDPGLNRITRYLALLPASDFRGETLYLRLPLEGGGYQVISPFFTPALSPLERYECRVGLGYTRILSEVSGLRCEVTIFVPPGAHVEVRDVCITNLAANAREVDAIPVVEYSHPDALKQLTNADWVPQTMQSRACEIPGGRVALTQYPFMTRDTRVNYFTSNRPASSYETDRRAFLGENEYGSWAAPRALQATELGSTQAERGENIGALMLHLGRLAPGQTSRFITLLGQAESIEAARPVILSWSSAENVAAAQQEMAAFWNEYLSALQVETPDADMQRMLNTYNPRQCYITRTWSRYLSLYQLGYGGDRGIGYRDGAQDTLGVMASQPEEARRLIERLAAAQKRDGSAAHQFNPLTGEGSMGDARERPDHPQYYSDDHLWLILAVTAYLKESGRMDFLKQTAPFLEQNAHGKAQEEASLLEHLRRALRFTAGDLGVHGLPRLGFADWNDTVNLRAGAESLFTACLYGRALLEMAELMDFLGDPSAADEYRRAHQEMRARFNACGWDGEWYLGYFDHDGSPLGSRSNRAGQIYLNSQTWAVLAGFAPPERARSAMDAAHRLLDTRNGLKLSTPGYNGFDEGKGGITTYPPGAKENGGVFLHTNPWAIIANALLGEGERAYQIYRRINPAARNDEIERYECEPYVYPQNVLGDEHPLYGMARNSWLTGTASWAYVAATQYLLGVRAEYGGLRIDPCIPSAWDGFQVTRRFRGSLYHIRVENPGGANRGVVQLTIDGQSLEGSLIPVEPPGGEYQILATLGYTTGKSSP